MMPSAPDSCAAHRGRAERVPENQRLMEAHHDEAWIRRAKIVRRLSWLSLVWMTVEGTVGITAGIAAASIALVGWALSSVVEAIASIIVIWRFRGSRTLSETAEAKGQKAVAISFWLLAPYVAVQSLRDLLTHHEPGTSIVGMVLTVLSVAVMPALGVAKHRLGARLGSGATAGEGTQNFLCAYLGVGVLAGLAANTVLGWWWLDPVVGLLVAGVAVREGREWWRGDECC